MRERSRKCGPETVPEALREFRASASGLVVNVALIGGVVAFGWSIVEIALIYLIEIPTVTTTNPRDFDATATGCHSGPED